MEALDNVRPYMESHGGNVELVSLEEGVARIRLEGSCDGCPASSSTLELAIKTALEETAPDLLGIEVEGIEQDLLNPVVVTGTPLPMAEQGAAQNGGPARHDAGSTRDVRMARAERRGRRARRGPAHQDRGARHAHRRGPGRGLAARLPRRLSELSRIDRGRRARRGDADLPELRSPLLPAAGRPLARRREAPSRTRSAARLGHRGGAGGAGTMSGHGRAIDDAVAARRRANVVTGLRGIRRGPAPSTGSEAPAGTARRRRGAMRPLRHRHSSEARAPARAERSADPLRLRNLLGAALGRPESAADGHPRRLARRLLAPR